MCGIGVTSLILVISNPPAFIDLIAVSLPDPGPFTNTSTYFRPMSAAFLAADSATSPAAKGVLFLDPLNPKSPALAHDIAFPALSVIVTIVLLKLA